MMKCKKDVVGFINLAYEYIEELNNEFLTNEKFILSNRGTYAFIMLIGSLHSYIWNQNEINSNTSISDRFSSIEKYIETLIQGLINLPKEKKEHYLIMKGAGADTEWFRLYQSIINANFHKYEPSDLIIWRERQDKNLQEKARNYIEDIEKKMKNLVLKNLKSLYGKNWELEINSFKRKCNDRLEAEKEKQYKLGMPVKELDWTEMLTIMDYKNLIEAYWTKKDQNNSDFATFENIFSINIGEEFNSKKEKTKWISYLNSYRNTIAHSGTKESGLSQQEVYMLESIYDKFIVRSHHIVPVSQ